MNVEDISYEIKCIGYNIFLIYLLLFISTRDFFYVVSIIFITLYRDYCLFFILGYGFLEEKNIQSCI